MTVSRHGLALAALALFAAPAAASEKGAAYRAVIADHANGKLTVIDPVKGESTAHFAVAAPARLKIGNSSAYVYATQGARGVINVLYTGVEITGHGDHLDIDIAPPELLDTSIRGEKPSHVNSGNGRMAFFFDGDGAARIVNEEAFAEGKGRLSTVKTAAPHHGVAKPIGALIAISIPHPTDSKALPVGIDLLNAAGASVAKSMECPKLHGEAATSGVVAFGCEDGLLLIRHAKDRQSFDKLKYPVGAPAERMVRNLAGAAGTRTLVGDFGADGMMVIDPVKNEMQFVKLPARRMAFAMEQAQGDRTFVITEDGRVHRMNSLTGAIEQSAAVTGAYSMEGGGAVARPRLAASGKLVLVTDPAASAVHVLDADTLATTRKIAVPGAPFDVVLVGGVSEGH